MGADTCFFTDKRDVDQSLVLEQGVEGVQDVVLMVIPPEAVVLGPHRGVRLAASLKPTKNPN